MEAQQNASTVERWGMFEVAVKGKTCGNPFTDYHIHGTFKHKNQTIEADGFYDGNGLYKVRCMPSFEGVYTYTLTGSCMNGEITGSFTSVAPSPDNHGPVRVSNSYHFAYEDGMPYYSIGTTCYVWTHQDEALQQKTLETLKNSAFNKIRFCIFPKHYVHNFHEPISYPYEGTPCSREGLTAETFSFSQKFEGNHWDFARFHPAHFQNIEKRVQDLLTLGIEADIILMHPYDCWGFSDMGQKADELYLHYIVNRLSAFRNIWWSLANEYDLMRAKTTADWEHYASIICRQDPYNHLRSIHNCIAFYDHSRPWITHCSLQRQDVYRTAEYVDEWRVRWKKPIVLDEICYEGNIEHGWGNVSAQELVRRFWEATCRGGYAGHGETYMHPEDILWWSHGGQLHGQSPARFQFLLDIIKEVPGHGLKSIPRDWDCVTAVPDGMIDTEEYYLIYYGFNRPALRRFRFDETARYQVDVIDTWNMTLEDAGIFSGQFQVPLYGREYMAVRLKKV